MILPIFSSFFSPCMCFWAPNVLQDPTAQEIIIPMTKYLPKKHKKLPEGRYETLRSFIWIQLKNTQHVGHLMSFEKS